MLEYSKLESDIFGVTFGRMNIEPDFTDWENLKKSVESSSAKYIRIKIKNPDNTALEQFSKLGTKVHLLEILRAYNTNSLHHTILQNIEEEVVFSKVNEHNKETLRQTILNTYDDIPFGNYTPSSILEKINISMQLECLSQYFYHNYYGNNTDKEAYLIYNQQQQIMGCLTIDFFENESYSYYVGVKKEFRKNDILLKSINYIHRNTQSKQLEFAKGSARLHNLFSQKAFDKSGMKCTGYDWIYLIENK